MMNSSKLLEIQPSELKFTFELKKQSSCSIQLGNKSNEHVAFKVKTTSPKKYCVRPNTGVIKPNATCDFTVTMQAQRVAPLDLQCKDKFLIQSTIVPGGTTEDEITSAIFSSGSENYVEEVKLRVSLLSPPASLVLPQRDEEIEHELFKETSLHKGGKLFGGLGHVSPPLKVVEGFKQATEEKDDSRPMDGKGSDLSTTEDFDDFNGKIKKDFDEKKPSNDISPLYLSKNIKDLTSKFSLVDSKLKDAELMIVKLAEEKEHNAREREMLKHELELLKRKNNVTKVQAGFPLLYVFMVALVGLAIGYFVHP